MGLARGMEPPLEVRSTIDRSWLDRTARREPVEHAYARWDLDRFPDRVRFVSALRSGRTLGYLLIWRGPGDVPVVQAYGPAEAAGPLAAALPARPLVAVVPPTWAERTESIRGPGTAYPEAALFRPVDRAAPSRPPTAPPIRRLTATDAPELVEWARQHSAPEVSEYPSLSPDHEAIWGAYDAGRLVGAARAAVRLPSEWVVAGVFVEPTARRKGLGGALIATIVAAAGAEGAGVGLYVREDRPEARRMYDRLGFRAVARRVWIDLGAGLVP